MEGRDLAPAFDLQVNGINLGPDIMRAVTSVEYESSDGIADLLKIKIANVDAKLSSSKLWTAGNEVSLFGGYGDRTEFIGGVQIVEPKFFFPADAMPTIEIVGYTRDHAMMDDGPAKLTDGKTRKQKNKRTWRNAQIREILEEKANVYGMDLDADDFSIGKSVTQKTGMSDYDLVKGLANLTGFVFWVDHDPLGTATLHFKKPESLPSYQDKAYRFRYSTSSLSTLLSFSPTYKFRGYRTALKVIVRNPLTGKTFDEEVTDDSSEEIDTVFAGDVDDEVEGPLPPPTFAKIIVGEYSVTTMTRKAFSNAAEVKLWARNWFRRQRDNFVVGRGEVIGVSDLRARQTHEILGLGRLFDDQYEFVRVRHKFADSGYRCEFSARKVL
jgi:phage protein D